MKISGDDARVALPLFHAEYGGSIPTSPRQLHIEEINVHLACELNMKWHSRLPKIHWSNIVRTPPSICFGAIYANVYYAVAIWSGPVARNLNHQNIIELRRLAIAPDAPKNTASRMLAVMRRLIKIKFPEVEKLISYQDTEVHQGTIYKAAGWLPTTKTKGDDWTRPNRKRNRTQSLADKIRWESLCQRKHSPGCESPGNTAAK